MCAVPRPVRSSARVAAFLFASFLTGAAWASSPAMCTTEYEQAQVLRKNGNVVGARDQLRMCAQPICPGLIASDCAKWLDEVQSSLPSVVPIAVDEAGQNLVDVHVSVDGTPLASAPPGLAIDVDPGLHRFGFERAGMITAETQVLVAVGQKNRPVQVTLHAVPSARHRASRLGLHGTVGTLGLVMAGVGVAGLAVGGVFGVEAIENKSDAHCSSSNVCVTGKSDPSALRSAGSDADLSTVFLVAGGVLAAAGLSTWLFAPTSSVERGASVRVIPVAAANSHGIAVVGRW